MTLPASNAPYQIIDEAYHETGLIAEGTSVNGEQIARGMRRLNDLIVYKTTKGLRLWLQVDTAVSLVAGQGTYTFKPGGDVSITKPLRALEGYYLDTSGIRSPLVVLSRDDFMRLSEVNQTGRINSYFVDKQVDQLAVTFWLTPDAECATGTAHLLLQQAVTQFTGLTDTMDFPLEWKLYLLWGLADEICGGQPEVIMNRCQQRAMMYGEALDDWDVEDAPTSLAPDQRSNYNTGMFV